MVAAREKRVGSQAIGDEEDEPLCCGLKGRLKLFDAMENRRVEVNVENRSQEQEMNCYSTNYEPHFSSKRGWKTPKIRHVTNSAAHCFRKLGVVCLHAYGEMTLIGDWLKKVKWISIRRK